MNRIYAVDCPRCNKRFDALQAEWCGCVGKPITVICPLCGSCFCQSDSLRTAFWKNAPPELRARRRSEQRERAQAERIENGSCEILVVDDDEEIRLAAAYMLQQMGYRVGTAATPPEALLAVERDRPGVVLTDALMPTMDGRELCRILKQSHRGIKVAVMTSLYTGTRYRNEAYREFGADAYLAKPIHPTELGEVIGKLAGRN